VLRVSDNGAGFDPARLDSGRRRGMGLANVRERLACLYPGEHRFEVRSAPGAGTTVTVRIPDSRRRSALPLASVAVDRVPAETPWQFAH
jgi:two-component system, LytTR family, sensor kinase